MKPRPVYELEIGGNNVRLGERTLIMGVLNVTPDSFSDGGRFLDPARAVEHGLALAREGADWLDVGGESTRPGSRPIPAREELRRVLPVIRKLREKLPSLPISIDTTKAEVAEQAVRAGANIVNDVSGLRFDAEVGKIASRYRTPLVLMHLRGRPETMQQETFARSIWRSLRDGLQRSIQRALAIGVRRSQLIIDPGFGFGKSRRQNYEILAHLDRLHSFHLPILVGTSRKSFVQAVVRGEEIGTTSQGSRRLKSPKSLWPTTMKAGGWSNAPQPLDFGDAAAVVASILAGAHIVRVHDVAAMLPAVRIADAVLAARNT